MLMRTLLTIMMIRRVWQHPAMIATEMNHTFQKQKLDGTLHDWLIFQAGKSCNDDEEDDGDGNGDDNADDEEEEDDEDGDDGNGDDG